MKNKFITQSNKLFLIDLREEEKTKSRMKRFFFFLRVYFSKSLITFNRTRIFYKYFLSEDRFFLQNDQWTLNMDRRMDIPFLRNWDDLISAINLKNVTLIAEGRRIKNS